MKIITMFHQTIVVSQKPTSKNLADSIKNKGQVSTQPVIKPSIDSATSKIVQQPIVQQPTSSRLRFTPDAPHYVMMILTKVDPIFSGEAKNAFFRYNRETYYNKTMTADLVDH